jgi:AraC-like DNA-binding protein
MRGPVERTLREASRRQSWTDRVRFVLEHTESFAELDLAAVAQRVQASERTLRRALDREQSSFAALLDEARERVAREKLAQSELTLTEVGTLLGYSSLSSFGRAFRAWTGLSPAEYRRGACVETRPESGPSSS